MVIENQYRKSIKPKAGSLKRSMKLIKREITQIINIRNERGSITTGPMIIKKIHQGLS